MHTKTKRLPEQRMNIHRKQLWCGSLKNIQICFLEVEKAELYQSVHFPLVVLIFNNICKMVSLGRVMKLPLTSRADSGKLRLRVRTLGARGWIHLHVGAVIPSGPTPRPLLHSASCLAANKWPIIWTVFWDHGNLVGRKQSWTGVGVGVGAGGLLSCRLLFQHRTETMVKSYAAAKKEAVGWGFH